MSKPQKSARLSRSLSYQNRVVVISEDKSKDIIKYGAKNDFPQSLIKQLDESGTATACISILEQYIYAEGLVNEQLGNTKCNSKQTFNELISEAATYVAPFQGIALYVMRNAVGDVDKVRLVPFEQVRLSIDGNYIVNPTFGGKYDKNKDMTFPAFYGAKITPQQLAEHIQEFGQDKGEILYYFRRKPMKNYYPIPTHYASIEDINTDAENSKYDLEAVTNSFLPSGILNIVGNYDNTQEDESGKTQQDYLDETLESFTGGVKDETGASGRQKLLILQAKTKEELAVYQPLSNEGILNAIDQSTNRIANKVARAFGVPPFLIGLGGNVGFATNIIADNIELFNNRIGVLQDLISDALKLCFPAFDFEMTKLKPIKYIDPTVLNDLTVNERRALAGYQELKQQTNGIQAPNN